MAKKRLDTASEKHGLTAILQKLYTRMTRQEAALKGLNMDLADLRTVIVNHIDALHVRLDEISSKVKYKKE